MLWSGLSVFYCSFFSMKGQKGRKSVRNEHLRRQFQHPINSSPLEGMSHLLGIRHSICPRWWGPLRFQGSWLLLLGTPEGVQCCLHTQRILGIAGSLGREDPSLFSPSAEPSRAPGLWRHIPAPPSISNYPCWGRRGKISCVELPKNTIFFNIYSGSFPPVAFDPGPAGSARRVSGPV